MNGSDEQDQPLDLLLAAWRSQFESQCAVLLDDPSDPFLQAAAFDGAITSVLLTIVHEIDASAAISRKGRTHSARTLLDFLSDRLGGARELARLVVEREGGRKVAVPIHFGILTEALERTQATRHGRTTPQRLERRHIDALADLGRHPDITDISAVVAERRLEEARRADEASQAQAASLLSRLPDDEIDRLADPDRLAGLTPFMSPKEMLDHPDYDECPICWRESFQPDGWDDYGGLHSSGQCLVCGYLRGAAVAYDEATMQEIGRLIEQDD